MIGTSKLWTPNYTFGPPNDLLRLVSLRYLAPHVTHMFHPNDPSRTAGNRHYLWKTGTGWVDPTTLDTSMGAMVGTMTADGTGGSLSYTPEIIAPTLVEGISILYTSTNVVVPILSIGFNRSLTAGERTALSGLITPIATAAGVSPASCSLVTGQEFQQRCTINHLGARFYRYWQETMTKLAKVMAELVHIPAPAPPAPLIARAPSISPLTHHG